MSGIGARLVALLARVSFKQLLLVAVAAVILASGLFGGLERAETTEIEALKVGRAVDTGPFDLTVERGRHTTEIESSAFPSAPPARSVVVVATVRNRSDRSVSAATLRDSVRLSGVAGLLDDGRRAKKGADVRPQVLLPADGFTPVSPPRPSAQPGPARGRRPRRGRVGPGPAAEPGASGQRGHHPPVPRALRTR
ncbi:MAG: hypothetical protein EON52_24650 [Actinomycetales bacterium]|nr:MAG: hypothetical protein EON52_24650 [Actinomycetales bacterium]